MWVVILAGGEGSRVWPLSRNEFPKQFLSFGNEPSLLQKTILRFTDNPLVKKILISTNTQYEHLVHRQIEKLGVEALCDVLTEPLKRNTAPAMAYCVKYLEDLHLISPEETILVLPSDHVIEPKEVFHQHIKSAQLQARSKIIIFGVNAQKPETGYGYIETGSSHDSSTYKIKKFTEKPSLKEAEHYLSQGTYYWNCGIFLFSPSIFWQEMKLYAPEIYRLSQHPFSSIKHHYSAFPDISIDYALLEKTSESLLCPISISWTDIGSWDSIYEVLDKDEHQNVIIGEAEPLETQNSLIISHGKKRVSTIGVQNLLIIDTEDVLLIVQKGNSQKVKKLSKKSSRS
ncbi:MAG TPA: mannose-1-phosphate guanylyltransferase/mannose-6-phosphate isomerase [Parachlamydiales bacterium]|nr:mannose-1-phosphate guanylyltransferase/mannose-6-phosphate isomerase [Parachlamydiales bacterium]